MCKYLNIISRIFSIFSVASSMKGELIFVKILHYLNSFGAKSWSDFRHTCHSWSPGNVLKVMASPDCCMSETAFRVDDNRGSSVPTEM